ncbi:hypothetical protein QUF49_18445 [Fictibacillus sp. b24]|uniref:hypothetical protein n=1 Tax=Fictibacillus sp. b24 TaxID=3055863 RepID=UPI0025A06D3D|nr:hypothetical protein [Fictibacillus sp. b24]MDM5317980.1 hypothetical protein [Fictibacillus sp. b24]
MRCVAAEAFLVLRDRRAGETLKSETLRMWLTACTKESEQPGTEIIHILPTLVVDLSNNKEIC